MRNRVYYGPYNLNGRKCTLNQGNDRSMATQLLTEETVVRKDGNVLVDKRLAPRTVTFSGRVAKPSGALVYFKDVLDEFKNAVKKPNRYLHISGRWVEVNPIDNIAGWTAVGDATNLQNDQTNFQYSTSSVSFDVNTTVSGVDYAGIYNDSLDSVDLTTASGTGAFWVNVFIPNAEHVQSVDVQLGNSLTAYWSLSNIQANYEDRPLESGWNQLFIPWSLMSETGSVDAGTIDFFRLHANYSESQVNDTGFLINGVVWEDEAESVNFQSTGMDVDMPRQSYHNEVQPFTLSLRANDPVGFSNLIKVPLQLTTISGVSATNTIEFTGSYAPEPKFLFDFTTASGVSGLRLTNQTVNEQLTVTGTSFSNGSVVQIDTGNKTAVLDNEPVFPGGVFPNFVVGPNKIKTDILSESGITIKQETQNGGLGTVVNRFWAQSIVPSITGVITNLEILGRYVRDDTDKQGFSSVEVSLHSDSSGSPGSSLFPSRASATFSFGQPYAWETVSLPDVSGVTLTSGTKYWFVFSRSEPDLPPPNGTYALFHEVLLFIGDDPPFRTGWYRQLLVGYNTAGGYTGGELKYADYPGEPWDPWTPTWNSASGDAAFRVEITPLSVIDYDMQVTYNDRFI